MSQLSHAQFPLRRHPHLLVDHRRARTAAVADSRGASAERRTGSGGRLQIGIGGRIASEFPRSRSKRWEHAGEDLGAEIFLVFQSVGAWLRHANLVVEALDESKRN